MSFETTRIQELNIKNIKNDLTPQIIWSDK